MTTITDHDTIDGVLEIAHLPGVFISVEIGTYFPENGCKIHVIALDISENTFKEIVSLQKNVYDLVSHLRAAGIIHFVAHPLFDINEKLTLEIVEKMVLLFDAFEVKNGMRAGRFNTLINDIISSLTKEKYEILANRHKIAYYSDSPWQKSTVGGSDAHSSLFIARSYTVSPDGETIKKFISSIDKHKSWAEGEDGDTLTLAHSIYEIGYRFYTERVPSAKARSLPYIKFLLNKFFNTKPVKIPVGEKIKFFIRKTIPKIYDNYDDKTFEEILDREAEKMLNDRKILENLKTEKSRNRSIFTIISLLTNRMICIYANRLMKMSFGIGIFKIFQSVGSLGFVHFLTLPYYITYYHQHKSKRLLKQLREIFSLPCEHVTGEKIALFTDTVHEINGVALTINKLIETANTRKIDLTVITCSSGETSYKDRIHTFKSAGNFALPEYPEIKLHLPPILEILDFIEKEGFTRIHVSTPGTLGLLAIFIAKLMDIPVSSTYHTDFPQYVMSLTNDVFLADMSWKYIIWFYNQTEEVLVPSKSTQKQIIEKGLSPEKVKPLLRWVDTETFSPQKRNSRIWEKYNMNGEVKLLYVGRISKEKNLELLADVFTALIESGFHSYLIFVGDGPYRRDLENKLAGFPVQFTGFLTGEELATLYASSDVFVFPSTTDTFGNVVLEAQASGLPVIVSDEGGPKELMIHNETGYIIKANDKSALVNTLILFIKDREKIKTMGEKARQFIETRPIRPEDMYRAILRS